MASERFGELREVFGVSERDLRVLAKYGDDCSAAVDSVLDRLYEHLLAMPDTSAYFQNADTLARAMGGQREYMLSFFRGGFSPDYFALREQARKSHDRVGLGPLYYVICYCSYLVYMGSALSRVLHERPLEEEVEVFSSFVKLVLMDMLYFEEAAIEAREERLQDRIREKDALNRFASARLKQLIESEARLHDRVAQLEDLMSLASASFEEADAKIGALRVLDDLAKLLGVEAAELWVTDHERGRVVLCAHAGMFPDEFREVTEFLFGQGFPGLTASLGSAVVSTDLQQDMRFLREAVKRRGFRWYAGAPVLAEGRVVAVIGVASLQPREWTEQQGRLVQNAVTLLGRPALNLLLQGHRP